MQWGKHRWEVGGVAQSEFHIRPRHPWCAERRNANDEAVRNKTSMNDGRKIVDAEPAAARQDRAHARALGAGRGLCRPNRRLPLYGVSPADTGPVPASAERTGFMAADGCPVFGMQHNRCAWPNATSSSTNIPNEDQPVLASASEC